MLADCRGLLHTTVSPPRPQPMLSVPSVLSGGRLAAWNQTLWWSTCNQCAKHQRKSGHLRLMVVGKARNRRQGDTSFTSAAAAAGLLLQQPRQLPQSSGVQHPSNQQHGPPQGNHAAGSHKASPQRPKHPRLQPWELGGKQSSAADQSSSSGGLFSSSKSSSSSSRSEQASCDSVDNLAYALNGDFKEESRKFRRTVFTFDQWRAHRSTRRYLRHAVGLPKSRVVWGLARPLAYVLAVSLGVALYHEAAEAGLAPVLWPDSDLNSGNAFGLSSFALSLLLVFRTNTSYGRWLEARKAWTTVSARSKDFARQALAYIPDDQAQLQSAVCRWVCAYSRSLMCALREDGDLEAEVQHLLLPHELRALLMAQDHPAYALQVLTRVISTADLPQERRSTANVMDNCLTQLQDSMAICDRILRSPIPLSYTRHTSRLLMIWLTVLPFMVWDTYRWVSVPICSLIAFLLLGIEEIGVSIEEPFSILPLEAICDSIEQTVGELHSTNCRTGQDHSAAGAAPELSAADIIDRPMQLAPFFPAPPQRSAGPEG